MEVNKKRTKSKKLLYEIFVGITLIGLGIGGYNLYKLARLNKENGRNVDSLFYSGCYNFVDSVKRVYDAGGREYINIDYKEIPLDLKKEYVNKKKLEGKLE